LPQGISSEPKTLQNRLCAAVDTARADRRVAALERSTLVVRTTVCARLSRKLNPGPPSLQEASSASSHPLT